MLVLDGAIGTLFYDRGVFINRSYEELNLSRPDMVKRVHQDYLNAGAEILTTNTFGCNRHRLKAYGLDKSYHNFRVGVPEAPGSQGPKARSAWAPGAQTSRLLGNPWGPWVPSGPKLLG